MIDSGVQILIPDGAKTISDCSSKQHVGCNKTTRHFFKTTRRFHQNITSFSPKQHVVFVKTTRHFHQNITSLSSKHHVVYVKTSGHF